ncbi:MAG: phosphoenolpyruvate carboxykinase (GTP) [Deltaproteobacteria bacterium]|nr:phosphoenolpyruvate carboxykinase (GTP) [Deltaproteobacteria bacterium]
MVLETVLDEVSYRKLMALENEKLHRFIADAIDLCRPDSVFVCTDSPEDIEYIRQVAIDQGEETPLIIDGHTVHYDGYYDQARDKEHTKYLVTNEMDLGANINSIDKASGEAEIREILNGIMAGKQMLIRFLSLGPTNSDFSISCCQITDSAYVAHSESLLYRPGYEQFKTIGDSTDFFSILHSAGELDQYNVSKNIDRRRIYIDLEEELVYSVNTQYAGNTVGLKKLSLRLAIQKAARECWLAEHMFILGVKGSNGRVTYLTGAYPSMCGKTSTAMLPGEYILGDDLAYLRKRNGSVYGANAESGIFGIIQDISETGDPVIFKALTTPREIIFSNVLINEGTPYWLGDGRETPQKGMNHSGEWFEGKKDAEGNGIPLAHKNARYTIMQSELDNCDPNLENPDGALISGIIYGGRDSDISVPCEQAFDWVHGVITKGASIESETTAATLDKEGVLTFNPMSNLDFLSMPVGQYVRMHLDFAGGLNEVPHIFAVNYFQREGGEFLTGIRDKHVWIKWMELRVHNEADAIKTPTGLIPFYEDLKKLFREVLDKEYTLEAYVRQFTCRVPENLAKIDRIERIYLETSGTPDILFEVLEAQRQRLLEARDKYGDMISPLDY